MNSMDIYILNSNYNLYQNNSEKNKYYLFNVEEGSVFNLNETSYFMISLIDGSKTINEIENIISSKYNNKKCIEDFKKLLTKLTEKDIILKK